MLTEAEREAVARARSLLERTHYDDAASVPERVTDARAVARGALELAAALKGERSARRALQARCEAQQEILGRAAYEALT